ncbi:hypothetical protein AWH49_10345 [Domibacillus aminovorans]|uniref:Uncharacterized protein n=1 Tax=Domibacillus aminovorans TaxID=29332 RepID=A0A177L9S2_9BACI|nr:hypothetical protein AWH49_10345 [Domibacillus aminovorans]
MWVGDILNWHGALRETISEQRDKSRFFGTSKNYISSKIKTKSVFHKVNRLFFVSKIKKRRG